MRKKINFKILLILAILAVSIAIFIGFYNPQKTQLTKLITHDETFKLKKLTNFQWERVFIFAPYTSQTAINRTIGYQWLELKEEKTNIHQSDEISLLVFLNQGKVTKYIEHTRSKGDFSRLGKKGGYLVKDAIFYTKTALKQQWLYIYKK
ncbi:MAG: hypothetical protein ACI86H_002516 [bacterium]|jgi:hypothetical protein